MVQPLRGAGGKTLWRKSLFFLVYKLIWTSWNMWVMIITKMTCFFLCWSWNWEKVALLKSGMKQLALGNGGIQFLLVQTLKKTLICQCFSLKVTGHSKILFFCRVSTISPRLFCFITCTFKRPSLQLFRFKISNYVPFCIYIDRFCGFLSKGDTLWNFRPK